MRRPSPLVCLGLAAALALTSAACGGSGKTSGGTAKISTTISSTSSTAATGAGSSATSTLGAAAATPAAPPGTAADCTPVPAAGTAMSWLPADFPMPAGTYAVKELPVQPPTKGAIFVVPMNIRQYVVYVLAEYPKAGFRLGRGDSEASEAEDSFARGTAAGAFRIRQPYCDPSKGELQISYIADVKAGQPGTIPIGPSTSSTPAPTPTTSR